MPAKWERCVEEVRRKEGSKVNAYAICTASTGLTRSGGRAKKLAATHQNFHTGKPLKRLRKSLKAPKVKCGGLKNSCGCPTCRTK